MAEKESGTKWLGVLVGKERERERGRERKRERERRLQAALSTGPRSPGQLGLRSDQANETDGVSLS